MRNMASLLHSLSVFILVMMPATVSCHGYMLEPPSRQSARRIGYSFVPTNVDDNAWYCGGIERQWDQNGGKCGVCGDPWDESPRRYEYPDGSYVKGVPLVNKVYAMGQTIEVTIRLTQSHLGYFIFRLCNRDTLDAPDATEDCLQQNILRLQDGATVYPLPVDCNGIYKVNVKLPEGLTCEKCFFQWKYHAGNQWGCGNGWCGLGGTKRQEEFIACADIVIRNNVAVTAPAWYEPAGCGLPSETTTTNTTTTTVTSPVTTSRATTVSPTTTTATTTSRPTTTTPSSTTSTSTTTTSRPTTTTPSPSTSTSTTTTSRSTSTTPSTTTPSSAMTTTTTETVVKNEVTSTTAATTRESTTSSSSEDLNTISWCLSQGRLCRFYCRTGFRSICDAIPVCKKCKTVFQRMWQRG